jgi:prepilin-type N-terminal cleavage/methylation domain-containing protein
MRRRPTIAEPQGFTLVELLAAMLVLVIGMLATLSLVQRAAATTSLNDQRVAATNLARELVEASRTADYDDLTPTDMVAAIQNQPNLGSGGSPWTLERRDTTYTIEASACAFDDPADELAEDAPDNQCQPVAAGVTGDRNGDDFRRVTFDITWKNRSTAHTITQTATIVNPAGGLGPRITDFYLDPAHTIGPGETTAEFLVDTTYAAAVHWNADDGESLGDATVDNAAQTEWSITWQLGQGGVEGAAGAIYDGTYSVIAQAFDDRDIPGDSRVATVVINRSAPFAPKGFSGGHDDRVTDWVDLDWAPNPERDIEGYRVYRINADGTKERVCPDSSAGAAGYIEPDIQFCADFAPPNTAVDYQVVALDKDLSGDLREGTPTTLTVDAPGPWPAEPVITGVSTVDNHPHITWDPPATGSVDFYRVYRDGAAYNDRVGRVPATSPSLEFEDSQVTGGTHTYYVTAVGSNYNESDEAGPAQWP